MNILMIGGACSLIDQLILKLRKEGHRVFLLTGSKYKKSKYEKVFERYDFPYEGDYLHEIFDSVSPDVTVFMGPLTAITAGMRKTGRLSVLHPIS